MTDHGKILWPKTQIINIYLEIMALTTYLNLYYNRIYVYCSLVYYSLKKECPHILH